MSILPRPHIGHTPFGHAGERFLNQIYHDRTGRFFNHNVHSVRVLDQLFGRNISLQTLDGIICHNGEFEMQEYHPKKTITFDGQNCLQVLQTLCNSDNYDYDFLITQEDGVHTLHLGKFGSVITPPNNESYFEVGKGKGLYKLKEDKVDDKSIITRLYVEGGSTNIRSEYRDYAGRLQLPYPQRANTRAHTLSDGTVIAAGSMTIGITDDTKR